jgi:hypothetical protein
MLAFFLNHWFQFNYAEPGQPFYKAADWPNVFVDIPLVLGAYFLGRARHVTVVEAHDALRAAHVEHAAKLDRLLDHLDPDTPGPMADVLDRLEPSTPSGIGVVLKEIRGLEGHGDEPIKPATKP